MSSLSHSIPIESRDVTPDAMDEIMDRLDRAEQGMGPEDQSRAFERKHFRKAVVLIVLRENAKPESFAIPLRNISAGGIAFLHPTRIEPQTRCEVRIPYSSNAGWFRIMGRVVGSRPVQKDVHEIGFEFDHAIATEEFDS